MRRRGDSKHNQFSSSKANTPVGKMLLLEFLAAVCSGGKVTAIPVQRTRVRVCLHTMPVAPVSSVPHAAHLVRLPLAKAER